MVRNKQCVCIDPLTDNVEEQSFVNIVAQLDSFGGPPDISSIPRISSRPACPPYTQTLGIDTLYLPSPPRIRAVVAKLPGGMTLRTFPRPTIVSVQ